MHNKALIELALKTLDEAKALDIRTFDVSKITSIADTMIVASGRSNRQVNALADKLVEVAKQHGHEILGIEGKREGEWVLVDLGDIIIHVMHPQTREYYQLEKLWNASDIQAEGQ